MTDDKTPAYYVLGWRVDVRLDADSFVYVASVREHPQIVTCGSTRSDALAQLRKELAAKVGPGRVGIRFSAEPVVLF